MNFDRNTVIGFVLLGVLFFFYFYYNNLQQAAHQKEQAKLDSIAMANQPKVDTLQLKKDSIRLDSQVQVTKAGAFHTAKAGAEKITEIETTLFKIGFTNKGGQPKFAALKKYKNAIDSQLVRLAATDFDKISYPINTASNQSMQTDDLLFNEPKVEKKQDGTQVVRYDLVGGDSTNSASVSHEYIIKPDNYQIDFNIVISQPARLLTQNQLNLLWQYEVVQQESDKKFEVQNTQVGYYENGEFDYHTIGRKSKVEFSKEVNWIGVRQRFFNAFLTAKNNFSSGKMEWSVPNDSDTSVVVMRNTANMQLKVPAGTNVTVPLQLFYGPADYSILKNYENGYSKLVNLGQGIYAFVRPINKYLMIPAFNFFEKYIASYGIIIALLTLIIRILISPLTYSSYLSGAKMRVLRPEIATLREKFGNDQQAMSMEQMKLFREAGVNPLGGCVPALLQIPIFFALYSFFNATVQLRGASFLWAKDLSAYDAPIHFGFHIPLLGDHLSIFTVLATVTSLLISVYSMQMTADQSNPMMKYMPYIFPFFMLFFFNSMPSALTWYYTVSNVVTLIIQFVITNYIIDHDKILEKIQLNRKKPKTKSKWQERLEQMQEQQKQIQDKQKSNKK